MYKWLDDEVCMHCQGGKSREYISAVVRLVCVCLSCVCIFVSFRVGKRAVLFSCVCTLAGL